ncbi:MAG TPA: hypothetical protein VIN09_08645, partial [Chloroflexota bacterium]
MALPGVELALVVQVPDLAVEAWNRTSPGGAAFRYFWARLVRQRSAALRPVDVAFELGPAPLLRCAVVRDVQGRLVLAPEGVAALRERRLDVLLNLEPALFLGALWDVARHGVWEFRYGEVDRWGGAPYAWELYAGERTCVASLGRLVSANGAIAPLYQGCFKTISHSYAAHLDHV